MRWIAAGAPALIRMDEMNDPELFDRARRILRWSAIAISILGWAIAGAVLVLLVSE